MKLTFYAVNQHAPRVVAARTRRFWMERYPNNHAKKCLPLMIANAHGWEILCPHDVEIHWNGGDEAREMTVTSSQTFPPGRCALDFCRSHFSRGVITFHPDYVVRTEPGWNLLVTAPFNRPKLNCTPLTGIVESDWLPYSFSMNWQMHTPGHIRFEKDEPFCLVFPIRREAVESCEPEVRNLADNPKLAEDYATLLEARQQFRRKIAEGHPDARDSWEKRYFKGMQPDGTLAEDHQAKLRVKEPLDLRRPDDSPGS